MRRSLPAAALAAALLSTPEARAFCGFYVGGGGAQLFNNATQVALMREGTRTVLSMANNYQGPPQDFAMVVPVPVILQKENVKTLAPGLFAHLDRLTAPRLVEYWEQDPCPSSMGFGHGRGAAMKSDGGGAMLDRAPPAAPRPSVRVEAQFAVGEYEIVILSADDALGLDTWLRKNGYNIPAGAEPYLRPYVAAGMKFFVAKVDIAKVKKEGEKTMLSPLRFHYDSELFSLPIRLGLVNSGGTQDLIVYVLSRGQRYEVANYPNIAVPTNLNVRNSVKEQFGPFYASLFDRTLQKHQGAVVTEYSWDAGSCDPCPGPALSPTDLDVLGADVGAPGGGAPVAPGRARRPPGGGGGFVLTRLHARYGKENLGEDLVFRAAGPIVGGREFGDADDGQLEQGARPGSTNTFQGRYIIRYPWMGPIACQNPQRGVWGGPPDDRGDEEPVRPATGLSFVTRRAIDPFPLIKASAPVAATLLGSAAKVPSTMATPLLIAPAPTASAVEAPVEPAPSASVAPVEVAPAPAPAAPPRGGCAGCQAAAPASPLPAGLGLLGALLRRWRRRGRL